ncbi:MAG TPA: DNA repair protein RecO [Pirellulales bacterium]|jgi:DNA repair protein RecO (recombination protein O)|nr:DNA repair protein RecO [Pirellulales bacterium]
MSSEKATALVLHVVEFSETSSVVTLFTREFGKIRGLAKGARRPKGPFESALDLLALCRIVFLRKSSGALDLLTEAKLQRRFRPRGHDLSSLYAGYYVAELLSELTDDYDPHPELFDAAEATLVGLSDEGPVASWIVRFELTALRLLGHLPSLEVCVECGRPVEAAGRVAFGLLAGGVLCKECKFGKRQVVSVSEGVLRAMIALADEKGDRWRQLAIDRKTGGELRGVLNHYLTHLLGHKPRMHEYLTGLVVPA